MLIAFDIARGTVVTGPEVQHGPNVQVSPRLQSQPESSQPYSTCEASRVVPDGGVTAQHTTLPQQQQVHDQQPSRVGRSTVPQVDTDAQYVCVVCGSHVQYNGEEVDGIFNWFTHKNGKPDCFGDGSMSDAHRTAVELTAHRLLDAAHQVQSNKLGIPCDGRDGPCVQPEKRVSTPDGNRWIETDVHLSRPRAAVEVFTSISQLDLCRRLSVLFGAGYDAYLVFDVNGRYEPGEIEGWLQRCASIPIRVGRFNADAGGLGCPASLTLGTRLTPHVIDPSELTGPNVPVFLQ